MKGIYSRFSASRLDQLDVWKTGIRNWDQNQNWNRNQTSTIRIWDVLVLSITMRVLARLFISKSSYWCIYSFSYCRFSFVRRNLFLQECLTLHVDLNPVQTPYFTLAESTANEREQRIFRSHLHSIWLMWFKSIQKRVSWRTCKKVTLNPGKVISHRCSDLTRKWICRAIITNNKVDE